jgi:hypothetical protein
MNKAFAKYFKSQGIEFAIEYNDKEMLTISINTKMFDILFDSNGITFYNNHTNVSKVVLNIEDLRKFFLDI